jgi:hypothetical protein
VGDEFVLEGGWDGEGGLTEAEFVDFMAEGFEVLTFFVDLESGGFLAFFYWLGEVLVGVL